MRWSGVEGVEYAYSNFLRSRTPLSHTRPHALTLASAIHSPSRSSICVCVERVAELIERSRDMWIDGARRSAIYVSASTWSASRSSSRSRFAIRDFCEKGARISRPARPYARPYV